MQLLSSIPGWYSSVGRVQRTVAQMFGFLRPLLARHGYSGFVNLLLVSMVPI